MEIWILRFVRFDNLVGAFQAATGKRGDLLALSLARLQKIAPDLQRVALSATVADPDNYRAWLAPYGDIDDVTHVLGDEGAPADINIMIPNTPEGEPVRGPWAGLPVAWTDDDRFDEATYRHDVARCCEAGVPV